VDHVRHRLRQLTKPAHLGKKRFELEWALPMEAGLATHVALFDLECFPPHALGNAEGADESDALLELWTTLTAQQNAPEAIAYVAEAYSNRTGRIPERMDHGLSGQDP